MNRIGGGGDIQLDATKPMCSISSMSENDDLDPGASTQMFQAFVDRHPPEASGPRWMRIALAGATLAGLD
ncbi:MAG: hypothetical protein GEU93_20130 [Propionibacteriales bacterium]|nr:hypothetical protein [Propionibacteriales bacterium]